MTKAQREAYGLKLGESIGALRAMAPEEILTKARETTNGDRTGLETSVDGYVLPVAPAIVRGAAMPLITGVTAQEVSGPDTAAPSSMKSDPLYGSPGTQLATDAGFRCPAIVQAIDHAKARQVTYVYEFEHPPPGRAATGHSSELNFEFGTWGQETRLTPADEKLSEQMQAYWANFVKTGDPNGEGLPAWPKFTVERREYLAFTGSGAAAKAGLRQAFCGIP